MRHKLSCAQGARGLLSPDRQKVCSAGIDPIIGQQQKSGCARSAALLVNSNPASFEICQSIDARMFSHHDPDGLVVKACQRSQSRGIGACSRPALCGRSDEVDVNWYAIWALKMLWGLECALTSVCLLPH